MIPKHLQKGDLQWEGKINKKKILVYYDDKATQYSTSNEYAVFANNLFVGWLQLNWTNYELQNLIKNFKPTSNYSRELIKFKKMMGG